MKNKSFITVMLVLVLVIVLIASVVMFQNSRFETREYFFHSDRLPTAFEGYIVAQISDLHNSPLDGLSDAVRDGEPDIILITGDLVSYDDTDMTPAIDFVRDLCEIAPVYFSQGNHDAGNKQYPKLRQSLVELGVNVIEDSFVEIEKDGDKIRIGGICDPVLISDTDSGEDSIRNAIDLSLSKVMNGDGLFTVLMAHRPEFLHLYNAYSADIVFCGHAHGGAVSIPFAGPIWAPGQGFFPKYTHGIYDETDTVMIVSRGLGKSAEPFRFNAPYELVFCKMTQADR